MGELKRQRVTPGDMLRVELGEGRHAYALISTPPLVLFFGRALDHELTIDQIVGLPVAFRIWVYRHDLNSGRWPRVGHMAVPDEWLEKPLMFSQDPISGRLALYHERFASSNNECPATVSECSGLERAAVWSAGHVEDRLRDYLAGRGNAWVKSLAIDPERVPPDQKD